MLGGEEKRAAHVYTSASVSHSNYFPCQDVNACNSEGDWLRGREGEVVAMVVVVVVAGMFGGGPFGRKLKKRENGKKCLEKLAG